jgi:hypothetical protein
MNASPVGFGRSLWTTSAIAGMTENGESATTVAKAVSSPSNDPHPADTRTTVRVVCDQTSQPQSDVATAAGNSAMTSTRVSSKLRKPRMGSVSGGVSS